MSNSEINTQAINELELSLVKFYHTYRQDLQDYGNGVDEAIESLVLRLRELKTFL